jgi:hypothetical protein
MPDTDAPVGGTPPIISNPPVTSAPVANPPNIMPVPSPAPVEDKLLSETFREILAPFSYDTSVFLDSNSYQYRALTRTVEQVGFEDFSKSKMLQYWILYCIYFATNTGIEGLADNVFARQGAAVYWKNTEGWQEIDRDPCNNNGWYGIACNENGQVTAIQLQRNQLAGVFPPEVSFLASDGPRATDAGKLRILEVYNNEGLTNSAKDDSWIAVLGSNLEVLNYGSTSFQGPIPKLPTQLVEFDCSYTLHLGPIPDASFQGLHSLTLAILDGNNYNSSIPAVFGTLGSLKYFYVREASLTGNLSYMRDMPNIVEHLVDRNPNLSGPIYSFIGELETLRSFSAADCGLVSTHSHK